MTAKRKHPHLERRLKRARDEHDRIAYRRSCREASRLFREARSVYTRDNLQQHRDNPRQLWRTVKSLLHPGEQSQWLDGQDTQSLAAGLSTFFSDKVETVRKAAAEHLRSTTASTVSCTLLSQL